MITFNAAIGAVKGVFSTKNLANIPLTVVTNTTVQNKTKEFYEKLKKGKNKNKVKTEETKSTARECFNCKKELTEDEWILCNGCIQKDHVNRLQSLIEKDIEEINKYTSNIRSYVSELANLKDD